jgi:predicted enzyme related to lactoylglutathione lyase
VLAAAGGHAYGRSVRASPFNHISIHADDLDESVAFYTGRFECAKSRACTDSGRVGASVAGHDQASGGGGLAGSVAAGKLEEQVVDVLHALPITARQMISCSFGLPCGAGRT